MDLNKYGLQTVMAQKREYMAKFPKKNFENKFFLVNRHLGKINCKVCEL